ncbi:MAG: helix-turn-helix domain-containing protein [Planctomycetota bacterium]
MITANDTVKKRFSSIDDVADFMGLHRRTIYTLASEGRIPGVKIGGKWLFNLRTIKKWVNKQMISNCAQTTKMEQQDLTERYNQFNPLNPVEKREGVIS